MSAPATIDQIVQAFLAIPVRHLSSCNWGTGPSACAHEWHVNDETYINGVILTIDADYYMGYLIECVDRTAGTLTYLAIAIFHGARPDGTYDHDSMVYEPDCGTFFHRTEAAQVETVAQWGVSRIYGMFDAKQDRLRASEGR